MSTAFKRIWKDIMRRDPTLDMQSMDFHINDLTARMANALSDEEWRNLYHEREAAEAQRRAMGEPSFV